MSNTPGAIAAAVQQKRARVIARICAAVEELPEEPTDADIRAVTELVREEVNRWADNICGRLVALPGEQLDPTVVDGKLDTILEFISHVRPVTRT